MATTTNYGWETPDDTDLVKDGALAMRTTANSIDSTLGTALNNKLHAGLVLVKTQTIGTAVTSVTVTNAFSSTYDAYKIVITGGAASTTPYLSFALTGGSSAYAFAFQYIVYGSSSVLGDQASAAAALTYGGVGENTGLDMNLEIESPYLTKWTRLSANISNYGLAGHSKAVHKDTGSYTGFTISVSAGTITGGTIAVYGYAKD